MNHAIEEAKAVIEATCNWYYIHGLLEGMVEEVCVAHPLSIRDLNGFVRMGIDNGSLFIGLID